MVDKIMHFHLKDACLDEDNPMCITTRLYADVVDMTDNTIVDACVKAAREAGINDAWLLDKKFVLDAIRDKIQEKKQDFPRWINVEDRLPENEKPVLVSAKRKNWDGREYSVVFTAFHTDGTTHTEDSGCGWNPEDTGLKYCEETDDYIVPEAWWEDVRYGEEFSKVYDTNVTHWMPLPEPPKEE